VIFLSGLLTSCNPFGKPSELPAEFGAGAPTPSSADAAPLDPTVEPVAFTETWDFTTASDYSFDTNYVEVTGGTATLKTVDTVHSGTDFNGGTHVGTAYSSSKLTLLNKPNALETHVNTIIPDKDASLLGYWRMDGNWTDSSGNAHHGVPSGDATVTANSKIGTHAGSFDGTGDFVTIPDHSDWDFSNGEFAISFWMSKSGATRQHPLNLGSSTNNISFDFNDSGYGLWVYWMSGGAPYIRTTETFNDSGWHHIVFTRDSTTAYLYVDGREIGTVADATNIDISGDLFFGAGGTGGSNAFNGKIDEVAIWSDSLSAIEVRSLYSGQNKNFTDLDTTWTPQFSSLVGYWKMDGNWQDSSGKGHTLTPANQASFSTTSKIGSHSAIFNGSGDTARASDHDDLDIQDNISVGFWIYVNNLNPTIWDNIIYKQTGVSDSNFNFYLYGPNNGSPPNKLRIFAWAGGAWKAVAPTPDDTVEKTWTHVIWTYDSTLGGQLYFDGVAQGALTGSGTLANNSADLIIGSRFDGNIDEVGIWSTTLSELEVKLIYNRQKQKYAGHYESPIIDTGSTSSTWTAESWKTELPFFKELPGSAGSESSADYSSIYTTSGLATGLVGLWHLNESSYTGTSDEVIDSSGNGTHGTATSGLPTQAGILSGGARFGVSGGDRITIASGDAPVLGASTSIAFWIKASPSSDDWAVILDKLGTDGLLIQKNSTADSLRFRVDANGGTSILSTTVDVFDGKWHHVVTIADNGSQYVYLDGTLDNNTTYTHGTGYQEVVDMKIGSTGTATDVVGSIDELAIWSRALSITEITQLYRRGANRIKMQVRSCDDSSCSGESWAGPDGTASTWFSELNNCNTVIGATGSCDYTVANPVLTTAPDLAFADYTNLTVPANQYFQYRVLMESDDESRTPTFPSLTSISLGPTKYFGNKPSVSSVSGPTFTSWTGFSDSVTGSCTTTYQVSLDKTSWYYHDGTNWTVAASSANANSAAILNANASAFATSVGTGTLHFKAFMDSDSSQSCVVNSITADGQN